MKISRIVSITEVGTDFYAVLVLGEPTPRLINRVAFWDHSLDTDSPIRTQLLLVNLKQFLAASGR